MKRLLYASYTLLLVLLATAAQAQIFSENCSTQSASWTFNSVTQNSGYWLLDANSDYVTTPVFGAYTNLSLVSNLRSYGSGTAPTCTIEVSTDGGSTWNTSKVVSGITNSYVDYTWNIGDLSGTNNVIRWKRTAGARGLRINNIELTGTPASGPTITASPSSLTGFNYTEGNGPSAVQNLSISGNNLTANITVTASSNYEISNSSSGPFGNSATINQSAGNASGTVYVRLKSGFNANTYTGNVTVTSSGASETVALSGTVTAAGSGTACIDQNFNDLTGWTDNGTATDNTHAGNSAPARALGTGDYLISPAVDNPKELSFFQDASSGGNGESVTIQYKIDSGAWTSCYTFTTNKNGQTETADLTNISGVDLSNETNVSFKFSSSFYTWYLDDVMVTCGTSAPSLTLTGSDPGAPKFSIGSANNVLYRVEAETAVEAQDITQIDFKIDAVATNLSELVSNYKLYYSADAVFDAGTDTKIAEHTTIASASNQSLSFSGFTQTIAADTKGYFFITADVSGTATAGEELQVNSTNVAVTHSNTNTPVVTENYATAIFHEIIDSPSDIIPVAGSESEYVSALENTAGPLNSGQGVQVWQFTVRDGGENGDQDTKPTIITGISLTRNSGNQMDDWADAVKSCDLFDAEGNHLAQASVTINQIQFSGFSFNVPDNQQKTLSVRLSIQEAPNSDHTSSPVNNDGDDFVFNISENNVTTASSGSSPIAFASVHSENGKNEFQVIATTLAFVQQPSNVGVDAIMQPYVTVSGTDANDNKDLKGTSISLTSTGTLDNSNTAKTATIINGLATFNDVIHTAVGTDFTLTASAAGATSVTSSQFDVLDITTFKPGDLVIVAYDDYIASGGADMVILATMVDIKPGTEFWYSNATYDLKAAPYERNNRWYSCSGTINAELTAQKFTYSGPSPLPAGSIICITIGTGEVSASNFTVHPASGSGTFGFNNAESLTSNANINISLSNPDAIFLMQGDWSEDLGGYREFYGTVLSGMQEGGTWYDIDDDTRNKSDSEARRSRIPPEIQCFAIQGTTSTGKGYGYFSTNTSNHAGSQAELLGRITHFTSYWTQSTGGNGNNIASLACSDSYTFSISGQAEAGKWTNHKSDNDWFNCGNWENFQVPDETVNVNIPSSLGANNQAEIDATGTGAAVSPFAAYYDGVAECKDLTISSNKVVLDEKNDTIKVHGNLTIDAGELDMTDGIAGEDGTMILHGNWTNNVGSAAFAHGESKVMLVGDSKQTITTAGDTKEHFHKLFVDNHSAEGIELASGLTVITEDSLLAKTGNIDLNGGHIKIQKSYDREQSKFIGNTSSNMTINGSGQLDSLYFTQDFNLNDFKMNRADQLAVLMTDLSANNMNIASGTVVMTVGNNYDVENTLSNHASEGLFIKSDANGTASLIAHTAAPATVERYLTANHWHFIYPALSAIPADTFINAPGHARKNPNFYKYQEDIADYWKGLTIYNPTGWQRISSGLLNPDEGYIVNYPKTRTYEQAGGNLEVNDKNFTLSKTSHAGAAHDEFPTSVTWPGWDKFDDWNLVGNPYTSAVDWNHSNNEKGNIENFVYYYDGKEDKYKCFESNSNLSGYNNFGITINGGSRYIPAGQSVMVKATTNGGSFKISKEARVHNAQAFYKKASKAKHPDLLRFQIERDGYTDETIIRTIKGASDAHDPQFDAHKKLTWSKAHPQIYTNADKNNLLFAINTIAPVNAQRTIPVAVTLGKSGGYSIRFTENNFNNMHVFFVDSFLNNRMNLSKEKEYTFTQAAESNENRFYVLFEKNEQPELIGKIPDQKTKADTVYTYEIPENLFADKNTEDSLQISAKLDSGEALPEWLSFDAKQQTFTGVPQVEQSLHIVVQAIDNFGKTAADTFALKVFEQKSGINQPNKNSIAIYPNPAGEKLCIHFSGNHKSETRIILRSITGKELICKSVASSQTFLDLSKLSQGVYLLEILQADEKIIKKIIKQ